jgi:hypothetical protein
LIEEFVPTMTSDISNSQSYQPADPREPVLDISIGDALRAAAARWSTRLALVEGHAEAGLRRRWTFAELLADAEKVARALLQRFAPGEHVAIWSANGPEWVLMEFWCCARWPDAGHRQPGLSRGRIGLRVEAIPRSRHHRPGYL